MYLAFVLLDFQHAGVRRRAQCMRQSVDMQQFREVSRTRTIYSTETHTSNLIHSEMGSQRSFSRTGVEWWWRGVKRTSLAAKFWIFWRGWMTELGVTKSLGGVFSEKPVDWTTVFKLEISSLADFYDVLFHGQFWVKNESKVPGRIREGDVVRAKSNRVREGNGRRFQGRRKGKEKSFCFVVTEYELILGHSYFYVVCTCIEFFGEVGHFTERSGFLELTSAKSWWFTEWLAVMSERGVVYRTKRMGPSTEPWGTPYMSCDGDEDKLLTGVDWYLSERYEWNHWSAVDWMPKNSSGGRGEFDGQ